MKQAQALCGTVESVASTVVARAGAAVRLLARLDADVMRAAADFEAVYPARLQEWSAEMQLLIERLEGELDHLATTLAGNGEAGAPGSCGAGVPARRA